MTVADTLAPIVTPLVGTAPPITLRFWDGSSIDATDPAAPAAVIRTPDALRRLLWNPSEIGFARAYVTGELDVEGDLADGLRRVWAAVRDGSVAPRISPALLVRAVAAAKRHGVIGRPLPAPRSEARPQGRLHSKRRDADVISHHYDLSNALYALLLDEHMAYSCAYWTSDDPSYTVADAQRDKLDLICRKLDLAPGARLLDVGCGWGALSVHAAKEYGAQVTGITLSAEQLAFGRERIEREGVAHLVELRLQDYRDVPVASASFDAIAAIEMGEHVGAGNYPLFLSRLRALLRDEGRLLIQQMSHGTGMTRDRNSGGGPFIERYIAPDMTMRPLSETLGLVEHAGFEVRDVHALREHYVRTVAAWTEVFEERYQDVVGLVGEEQARVWRLYLVGGALAFEQNRMGVDQVLAVRTTADGRASMPPTRLGWEPHATRGVADAAGVEAAPRTRRRRTS